MNTSEIEVDATKQDFSSVEVIKSLIAELNEHMTAHKMMVNTLRSVLKDTERNAKELDKLRNKRIKSKSPRSPDALPSGITKPVAISDELAKFLGVAVGTLVPRNEVTKGVSTFVKTNELSDPSNKQKFILDERPAAKTLRVLLGNPKEDVTYFNLQRYLKHHYLPVPSDAKVLGNATEPSVVVVPETVSAPPAKKKILVKKPKVSSELAEEA